MKAGKSPCPLDQVAVIVLKRCPYLRTFLTSIVEKVWQMKRIPSAWKAATTILIDKKGEANGPGNLRSITLQPICLKIFTSVLRSPLLLLLLLLLNLKEQQTSARSPFTVS